MSQPSKWERSAEYWRTLPPVTNLQLMLGIFFLFTSFGLVVFFITRTWVSVPLTVLSAFITGAFSVAWAFAGFRRVLWLMFLLLPLQIATSTLIKTMMAPHLTPFPNGFQP
jgi:hypothetical protein